MPTQLNIDLAQPPERRWMLSSQQCEQAVELLDLYMRDLGTDDAVLSSLAAVAAEVVPPDYQAEVFSVADALKRPLSHLLAGNLYYDAIKTLWGCTAFAVNSEQGPLHARNLDWMTQNRILNDHTLVATFTNSPAGPFTAVGWPGFVGVLSAVAPKRFSVSLNAVLSSDPSVVAIPVVFLLRQVLEQAQSYGQAVEMLANTPIASDCLLLVAGPLHDQMCVIERTPTRHAVRSAREQAVFVTNDYLLLDTDGSSALGGLHATACGRRERVEHLVRSQPPQNLQACLGHLSDLQVRMQMTVQQMALDPRTGEVLLHIP